MSKLRFEGKVALITGSGSPIGLGRQYARALAENGAKVVIHGRKEAQVKDTAAALEKEGFAVMPYVTDITCRDGVFEMIRCIRETWGRIDILVNNAGAVGPDFWPYSGPENYQTMQQVAAVNVNGTLYCMEACWPIMKEQGGGVIVNASSNSVFGVTPTIAYPATKASVLYLTRIAALVGQADNIKVNAIAPCASSQLTMQLPDSVFKDRLIAEFPPEKAAAALAALCHEDCPHTGAFFSIGGGKINRYNFFNTECFAANDLDQAMESLQALASSEVKYEAVNSAFDDMRRYGFTADEYQYYGYKA